MKLQSILPEFFQKTTGFDVQFAAFLALLTFTSKKNIVASKPAKLFKLFFASNFFAVPSLRQPQSKSNYCMSRLSQ